MQTQKQTKRLMQNRPRLQPWHHPPPHKKPTLPNDNSLQGRCLSEGLEAALQVTPYGQQDRANWMPQCTINLSQDLTL